MTANGDSMIVLSSPVPDPFILYAMDTLIKALVLQTTDTGLVPALPLRTPGNIPDVTLLRIPAPVNLLEAKHIKGHTSIGNLARVPTMSHGGQVKNARVM
ncbi:hypothetical protein H2248_012247 [Termitomyces sp. 'cryptogamus']|nr:hypothetical protein H2248_012247 [Termitomyces sp. 'cryptogamus']